MGKEGKKKKESRAKPGQDCGFSRTHQDAAEALLKLVRGGHGLPGGRRRPRWGGDGGGGGARSPGVSVLSGRSPLHAPGRVAHGAAAGPGVPGVPEMEKSGAVTLQRAGLGRKRSCRRDGAGECRGVFSPSLSLFAARNFSWALLSRKRLPPPTPPPRGQGSAAPRSRPAAVPPQPRVAAPAPAALRRSPAPGSQSPRLRGAGLRLGAGFILIIFL